MTLRTLWTIDGSGEDEISNRPYDSKVDPEVESALAGGVLRAGVYSTSESGSEEDICVRL